MFDICVFILGVFNVWMFLCVKLDMLKDLMVCEFLLLFLFFCFIRVMFLLLMLVSLVCGCFFLLVDF